MKKILAVILASVVLTTNAFAAQGTIRRIFNAQTIAGTGATVVSNIFPVKSGGYFGLWHKATSAVSTPNIRIEYEMSYDGSDTTLLATPSTANPIVAALTAETAQTVSIAPVPMAYMRIKATGNLSNATDTTITAYLFEQG